MSAPNPRVAARNRLFLWGFLPSLLLLGFALKVILMVSAQSAGSTAFDEREYDASREEFASTRTLNLIETWKAPFNEGDARFGQQDFEGAIEEFEAALEQAPDSEHCMIRVNIALSHEEMGDDSRDEQDTLSAIESWREGRKVLADGGCDTPDAQSTDQRLEEKLDDQNADDDSEGEKKKEQGKKPDPELEKKKKQLEKKNNEGNQKRKDSQDLNDYPVNPSRPDQSW